MDISLDEVKEYLRIDGDEEDSLISFFISAAKTHLENAGVTDKESELYKLAVLIYVTDAYENRNRMCSCTCEKGN